MFKRALIVLSLIFCLYRLKYEVTALEDLERSVDQEIIVLQKDYAVLTAEWKFLTNPDRIQFLANKYLKLENTTPYQLSKLDDYCNNKPGILVVSKKRKK